MLGSLSRGSLDSNFEMLSMVVAAMFSKTRQSYRACRITGWYKIKKRFLFGAVGSGPSTFRESSCH